MSEYNLWNETLFLIKSEKNRKRLEEAIDEMKKGKHLKNQSLKINGPALANQCLGRLSALATS